MTTTLLLALTLLQAPAQSLDVDLATLALSGPPVLARGISVAVMASPAAAGQRSVGVDAWGCVEGSLLCRHETTVVEDGVPVGTAPGRIVFTTASDVYIYHGLPGFWFGVIPPDCRGYADCRMWYDQQVWNRQVTQELRARSVRAREMAAAWEIQNAGKERPSEGTPPPSRPLESGKAGHSPAVRSSYRSGGSSGGDVTVSGHHGGGVTTTTTSYRGSGGSDRTGTARER